jgi:two-component system sensor histidine kinase KdpD
MDEDDRVTSEPTSPRRGTLRIYLGAAPGVGKTFAMLNEGRRRNERGTDVVVGFVETHGRARTADQVGDLEVVPRRTVDYRGTAFEEMDVDAVLGRRPRPRVALVDELAHTNVPGCRNQKRWQDVGELLDAGIDVVSTVNVQHLESLNDVVERITGVRQRETIPDEVVRAADQIELVDQTPEALRRRMAHGNIYGPDRIDAALANYFRPGNLAALRELALLWVADRVDDGLEAYRERHGITEPWETRERVVVAVSGAAGGDGLIRRAARIAQRAHGELLGVHVETDSGLTGAPGDVAAHRRLLEEVGGVFREVTGSDVATALIDFARAENATQIVLGASRRSRWQELVQGSVINRVTRLSGPIDIHVISTPPADPGAAAARRLPRLRRVLSPVPRRRQLWGWGLAAAGLPVLTVVLHALRDDVGLPSVLLLYLVLAMGIALVGGVFPALGAVLAGFLLANWYFTPPYYRFTIAEAENVLALAVYVASAGIVSVLVDRVGRSRLDAARARAEAEAMAALAGSLTHAQALPELVAHLRTTFGMRMAALYRRDEEGATGAAGGRWRLEASAGVDVPADPTGADITEALTPDLVLGMSGTSLLASDHRVLAALGAQLATAVEAQRLQAEAARASVLAQADDLRNALLQAVSHDLRTPLASIKASVSSVRQPDVDWSPEQVEEFHATIEEETDRLDALVTNLLDMSRVQAGALRVDVRPTVLEEVVPAAIAGLGARAARVVIDVPETLPPLLADPALLERAIANLVDNAVTASPPGTPVRVEAGAVAGRVSVLVVDEGPGIDAADRDRVFRPFQRLVDHGTGVGLGLAIARGFVAAMGGELAIEDTPGGGTTMVVALPAAEAPEGADASVAPGDRSGAGRDVERDGA